MGLSTTYTKVETDFLLQQIDKKVVGGYKGDLRKSDPAPTEIGYYILLETGTYTNLGGINATAGNLNFASFDGNTWSLIAVDIETFPLKTIFNSSDNSQGSTDKAVFDYLSSISFDGKNMILSGNNIDTYHESQFNGWSVYGGTTIGSDANGTFANIPAGGTAVVYNENLIYPSKPLKFIINVEQTNPNLKLIIDDSNPNAFGLSQVLSVS